MNRRRLLVVVLFLGLVVAAPFVLARFGGFRSINERRLARAAGIPMSVSEFPMPRVARGDDAAPDYYILATELQRHRLTAGEERILRSFGGRQPPPRGATLAAVRRLLAGRRRELAIIHRATGKPSAAFPIDFNSLVLNSHQPVPGDEMRSASSLLRAEAAVLAADGRWDEAVRTEALGFRMASHAASAPYFIAYLIGLAMDARTLGGMADLLQQAGPNARVCSDVLQSIEANVPRHDIARSLKGEFLAGSAALESARLQMAQKRDSEIRLPRGRSLPRPLRSENDPIPKALNAQWETDYLHWIRLLMAAGSLPGPERMAAVRRIGTQFQSRSRNPLHAISDALVPVLMKGPGRQLEVEARRAVAIAAAQALLMTAQSGRRPSAGPNGTIVTPGRAPARLPVDPWWGTPVVYRAEPRGFVVYSRGERGTFDGRAGVGRGREMWFRWKGN